MKAITTIAIALGIVAISATMQAATYRDTDLFGGLGTELNSGESIVGFFQIDASDLDGGPNVTGYNSSVEEIVSASVAFLLGTESNLVRATVDIVLGSSVFRDGAAVPEYDYITSLGGIGSALFDLQDDGRLQYTITAESGTFFVYEATLRATSGPRSIGVPDGGSSVFLLGFGLMGLGFLKRKLSA